MLIMKGKAGVGWISSRGGERGNGGYGEHGLGERGLGIGAWGMGNGGGTGWFFGRWDGMAGGRRGGYAGSAPMIVVGGIFAERGKNEESNWGFYG